jgi:hypothetical protein
MEIGQKITYRHPVTGVVHTDKILWIYEDGRIAVNRFDGHGQITYIAPGAARVVKTSTSI